MPIQASSGDVGTSEEAIMIVMVPEVTTTRGGYLRHDEGDRMATV